MRFEIVCLLVLAVICAYAVEAQNDKDRFLLSASSISFSTFTIIKKSTTITSTLTSTTTCTTSSATLTTCTIGRRRRGLFYDEAGAQGRDRRGLFYDDEEVASQDGSAFLATDNKASDPVNEVAEVKSSVSADDVVIPLEVQAGFALPQGQEGNRFLLAFGTSTITSYTVSSTTISLTAFCSSTSGFALCGGVGK